MGLHFNRTAAQNAVEGLMQLCSSPACPPAFLPPGRPADLPQFATIKELPAVPLRVAYPGDLPRPEFPSDRPRPAVRTFAARRFEIAVPTSSFVMAVGALAVAASILSSFGLWRG